MNFYLAPLEGITGYIYRNAVHRYYGRHISKYYIPFIEPHTKRSFNHREWNDILPEHNQGMCAIPQILTKSGEDFLRLQRELLDMGYDEVNLNLGCPSGTVVSRGRGAGLLDDPDVLDELLSDIFENAEGPVSVKTRIGISSIEEFEDLFQVYQRYPIHELTIHPRLQREFYKGKAHVDLFEQAAAQARMPVCYNGDIDSVESWHVIRPHLDPAKVQAVMLGRGMMANPQLIELIAEDSQDHAKGEIDYRRLKEFHDELLIRYGEELSGDRTVLYKMKELWAGLSQLFPEEKKDLKALRKASSLTEYKITVNRMFAGRYD